MNASNGLPHSPLFIVGSPRSGTSVLVDAMFAAGYGGFREGNFFGLLKPVTDTVDTYFKRFVTHNPKVLISQLNAGMVNDAFLEVFKRFYQSLNPREPWLDKTCNAPTIFSLPRIASAWPSCRIIFAKRRGLENVRSRLKKFPERDFTYHCRDWAVTMESWRQTAVNLETDHYLELDQRDLLLQPDAVASRLASFLSLDLAAEGRVSHALKTLRSQESGAGTASELGAIGDGMWTKEQEEEFMRVCGGEMESFGYSYDQTYRR